MFYENETMTDIKGCLAMYCPICGDTRMVDYPENWEEFKKDYSVEKKNL